MLSAYQKFQLKRWRRRRLRALHSLQRSTGRFVNDSVIKPMARFGTVRRFVLGWVTITGLIMLGLILQSHQLDAAYKHAAPKRGGVYTEGIVGELSNFNPMFATGNANQAATRLMFSSLYEYDRNGQLKPDLAEKIEIADDDLTYTVTLRDDIFWHDGEPLTADDVVYTFQTIQTPDARSPLYNSWKDITIKKLDSRHVQFILPNKFAPFQLSLTAGIVPEHILGDSKVTELRTSSFNQAPIGSGPFIFKGLDSESGKLEMVRNEHYHGQPPYLNRFVLNTFADEQALDEALRGGELTALADITVEQETSAAQYQQFRLPLTNAVFAFFNTQRGVLKDRQVREALAAAVNREQLLKEVHVNEATSRSPLLAEHNGFNRSLLQPEGTVVQANKLLDQAGWKRGPDGIRKKGSQRLSFVITSQAGGEFPDVSEALLKIWKQMGVEVNVQLLSLDELRNDYIVPHNYDVLVFGIAIGADPDVFAYWHSSQTVDGGFNLSEYKSKLADEALESGRTRLDPALRAAKYQTFTRVWLRDAPAVALYRTSLNYVQSSRVVGFQTRRIIDPADRFNDVEQWAVTTTQALRK